MQAVQFGRTLARDVRAVYVTADPDDGEALRKRWERQVPGVPLVIVESPYRAVIQPTLAYLDVLDQAWPPDKEAPITIVVLPEYVARHWWERLLYNQTAKRLKAAILGREHTVIADVPYRRDMYAARPGGARRRRTASRRPSPPAAVVSWLGMPDIDASPFRRAVVALNGGPSDERIVRLVATIAAKTKAELIAVHVVEIDWTPPLDADIAGRSEDVQRVLDMAEAIAESPR